MRRPLLIPLLCLAGGILCAWWGRLEVTTWWLWSTAVFAGAVSWSRGRTHLLPVLVFMIGALLASLRVVPFSAADLRLVAGEVPTLATVSGRLATEPELRRGTTAEETEPLWRVVVDCDQLDSAGGAVAALGQVMVFSQGSLHQRLHRGTRVAVFGVLSRPARANAAGLFDYREKLRREGIHYQLLTRDDSDWRRLDAAEAGSVAGRFRRWAVARLRSGLPTDESVRLLSAMILGQRTGLTDEVAAPFMRSGTMHIFAISGLHVAMVAGILVVLLRVARVPRAWCGLIVMPALWAYCHVTGWQSSATRATIMMSVVLLGWAFRRPVDLLNSVCAAGLIILLWNPLQLLQASFQLSFAVVATIALTWPRFDEWGERWFSADPLLPPELESWWRRQFRRAGRWAYSLMAISVVAWLGSMPLIAFYFHLWTPGSLLANPPVVLLTMCAIGSAMGALLGTVVWPWAGEVFAHGAWFWVACQARISEWVAELPHGWTFVASPSLAEVLAYYALVVGWSCRWFNRRRLVAAGVGVVCLLAWRWQESRGAEITVFNQSANAVFCDLPGTGNDLLIDCGRSNGVERVLVPFARSRGMRRIEHLLLTHGDVRHVEGFDLAVDELRPDRVFFSGIRQRSEIYRSAVAKANSPTRIKRGDLLGRWRVLHPPETEGLATADDVAVTLLGEVEGSRVMVMPDACRVAQHAIMEHWRDLNADVLIVGCPREGEAILDGFLRRVSPTLVVIQDNWTPAYDRADGALLRQLRRFAKDVRAVSRRGSVTLRLEDGDYSMVSISGLSR